MTWWHAALLPLLASGLVALAAGVWLLIDVLVRPSREEPLYVPEMWEREYYGHTPFDWSDRGL